MPRVWSAENSMMPFHGKATLVPSIFTGGKIGMEVKHVHLWVGTQAIWSTLKTITRSACVTHGDRHRERPSVHKQ